MNNYFKDKVTLITGAASGIGRAASLLYATHGARVIVSDSSEDGGNDTTAEIKGKGGKAVFIKADVSKPEECEKLVKQGVDTWGRIDVACNNAGILGERKPLATLSIEGWRRVIETNLNGVFYCLKYEIEAMLEQGGGVIVNTASVLCAVGFSSHGAYVAAKHGVVGLTQTAALEYSARGIRVNAVAPGFIDTPLLGDLHHSARGVLAQMHPAGRLGQPEEVAELILWLSSNKASFVTGATYPVDGGYLAR